MYKQKVELQDYIEFEDHMVLSLLLQELSLRGMKSKTPLREYPDGTRSTHFVWEISPPSRVIPSEQSSHEDRQTMKVQMPTSWVWLEPADKASIVVKGQTIQ